MKIVYCIAKTHGSGGMERVLSMKANYLVEHGHEIVIITTDQRGLKSFFMLDDRIKCYDLAINYEENNGKSFVNKALNYPIKQRKHKRRLTALLKEQQADIVISMFCNEASFITEIKDGSKKILEVHFSKLKRLQYGRKGLWALSDELRSKMDDKLVLRFDKFVVLTREDAQLWGAISNLEVIPNPCPFKETKSALLENKRAVAVGRYEYQKGFDLLIEAWSIVHQTYPDWHLDILGEGHLKHELEQQIYRLGLQESVSLELPTIHLDDVYLRSSLLVMSSRYEGFGMVLIEAQSFGIPVVSFACKCGPRDIISGGIDGLLVSEENVEQLATAIMELIEHDDLRKYMGAAAKENSVRFSIEQIMEKWLKLFEQITNT